MTGMTLEGIMISEINQERNEYCIISLICEICNKPNSQRQNQLVVARGRRWGTMGDGGQKVQTSSYKIHKL